MIVTLNAVLTDDMTFLGHVICQHSI